MTSDLDQFQRSLSGRDLRLVRHFRSPPEELWTAITEPERLTRWLGTVTAVGDGVWTVDLGGGDGTADIAQARPTRCEPPHLLSYDWTWQDEPVTRMTVELAVAGAGSQLVLSHDGHERDQLVVGYGGGWESCLLGLATELGEESYTTADLRTHEKAANEAWRGLLGR